MIEDQLDRPMRDLRISVIDNCNFRCAYCMPREVYGQSYQFLSANEMLSHTEIARLVRIFGALGVRKVKITGGEPLLRAGLDSLIREIGRVPEIEDIGLITNGYFLAKHASRLRSSGLNRVTVSLDSLDEETWQRINGRGYTVASVLAGIDAALQTGFYPVKINAVVQRGVNDGQVMDMVRGFRGPEYRLRFIEYMDVGTLNNWSQDAVVPSQEIRALVAAEFEIEPVEPVHPGEVASRYRYVDGSGEIGFISSVTEPFCRSCNRARLSADGKLFTCLFAKDGMDLRSLLHANVGDEAIRDAISAAWGARDDRYSELRAESHRGARIEMYQLGG